MKRTFDTNIFLFSLISKICIEKINDLLDNKNIHILLRSITEECSNLLFEFFRIIEVLLSEIDKKEVVSLIESSRYDYFKSRFPQHYKAIYTALQKNYFKSNQEFINYLTNLKLNISKLLKILNDNKLLFPVDLSTYKALLQKKEFKENIAMLSFLKNLCDQKHIVLCNEYSENSKSNIIFLTLDFDDIVKHKDRISELFKSIIIRTIEGFDFNKFIIQENL